MEQTIRLYEESGLNTLGTRFLAKRIRQLVEDATSGLSTCILDFSGVDVTQSFIDELIGPLLLRAGPTILSSLAFRGCSEASQAVIRFVISDRLLDFETRSIALSDDRARSEA